MKVKVSQKQVKDNYCHVISVGYCDLSHLLMHKGANFYTCGVYGWNSNIFDVGNGVAICTGYRPFGNIKASYNGITKKYNDKAKAIYDKYYKGTIKQETKEKQLNKLLDSFINECLQLEKQKNYNS